MIWRGECRNRCSARASLAVPRFGKSGGRLASLANGFGEFARHVVMPRATRQSDAAERMKRDHAVGGPARARRGRPPSELRRAARLSYRSPR